MVAFNANIGDEIPNYEYMYVGFVKIKLKNPKEDGLVTKDEADDVSFIEDRLEMESLRWRSGKYIGRIISNGEVTFIYALKLDFEWSNTVSEAMKHFEYEYEYGSRQDMEWEVYQKLLFPTQKEWQIITNHHTCNAMKEQGDTLNDVRAIEHKAYFKDPENRQKFIELVEKEGFRVQKTAEIPFRGETMFGVEFYRKDKPFYYDIDALTMQLIELSESCEGLYDGWECALVKG
jgi:regulator of RNase E activity RraB